MNNDNTRAQLEESRRIILEASRNHQLVIFVGAGASIASGLPSWNYAVKEIANRLNQKTEELDNLKIPQYYYNSRSKKEYTQLMRKIFKYKEYIEPNGIHDRILRFNPNTIITTNYDTLIEQAAEKNNEIIDVVSKDSDLPYRTGRIELIKMHGDFANDNFVLKEDDYLSYGRTFRLIENYVKSIIGTKVILFIGYSFNDPDIKQIFSWAKDILKGDFQRAYLIEANKQYDENEYEYFKYYGINVLYSCLLTKKHSSDVTANLLAVLDWLLADSGRIDIDLLISNLAVFESFNYVDKKHVEDAFSKIMFFVSGDALIANANTVAGLSELMKAIVFYNRSILKTESDAGRKIVLGIKQTTIEKNKIEFLIHILEKSSINKIEIRIAGKITDKSIMITIPVNHAPEDPLFDAVFKFNYETIRRIAQDNQVSIVGDSPEQLMRLGYIYFVLYEFLPSYRYFVQAKKLFYHQNKKVQYFLAVFNQYLLAKRICYGNGLFSDISDEDLARVKEELKTINLERSFKSICSENISYDVLKRIYTFTESYAVFQSAYKTYEDVRAQASMNTLAFFGSFAFNEMRLKVADYYLFMALNYNAIDSFTEHTELFKMYFNGILDSIAAPNNMTVMGEHRFISGNIHAESLEPLDVMVALKFLSLKELKEKLNALRPPVNLSEEALGYLQTVLENCNESIPRIMMVNDFFWKIITLIGYCKLNGSIVILALKKISSLYQWRVYGIHDDIIVRFLNNVYSQKLISNEVLESSTSLLQKELHHYCQNNGKDNLYVIRDLLFFYAEKSRRFDDVDFIKKNCNDTTEAKLLYIYDLLGDAVKEFINRLFEGRKIIERDDFDIYYYLLINHIVDPESEYEQLVLDSERSSRDNAKVNYSPFRFLDNSKESFLFEIINLLHEKLIMKNKDFKELIEGEENEMYSWLLNYEGYDYSKFDYHWLLSCPEGFIKEIAKVESAKHEIQSTLISNSNSIKNDYRMLDIYFKYFA